ncbi:MAG: tRNA uridine-5-carboxymethylaminomethyl(34) synthesis enzyme MnmG [Firmicutes bacterium]|nr:tRNA uridine-5-carboxymethylaminomethyl(34) synthesis enzyme MnmG [Bacillota bacterium]
MEFDAIVIGAGHAGVEAGLALAKLNKQVLVLSISLDNTAFLACNPSIGGTAKGHLVKEIDALGGIMGIAADKTLIQLRMLNMSKGFAVQSLRAQVDKTAYHQFVKQTLENQPNLQLREGEAVSVQKHEKSSVDHPLYTVKTTHLTYTAKVVIFACGVYLNSKVFVGSSIQNKGPSCFAAANQLSNSLAELNIPLRRFKTGTPARLKKDTIDLSALKTQAGEELNYTFSSLKQKINFDKLPCYLGYTNEKTHQIIRQNISATSKKQGLTEGEGARYCPSIEDKIERFNKERHPFFLEPEGLSTQEMYVQGISTSLPAQTQLAVYRSLDGFKNAQIMRDAYAIEYDCIDPKTLSATLMSKNHSGLFFAGQINGTSGYEEAAAQGLVAGVNAALFLDKKPPLILRRDNSYIGVMIDDLVTKGADEPYRMMTSRAEYRLHLRQDNADLRLAQIGKSVGLLCQKRYKSYQKKVKDIKKIEVLLDKSVDKEYVEGLIEGGIQMPLGTLIKRHEVSFEQIKQLPVLKGLDKAAVLEVFIGQRYQGYLQREDRHRKEQERLENIALPQELDYTTIHGLRNEAAEKLNKAKPHSIAHASRIFGVNPADINVLLIRLRK